MGKVVAGQQNAEVYTDWISQMSHMYRVMFQVSLLVMKSIGSHKNIVPWSTLMST